MPELTKKQIKRQDFADNEIFELLENLSGKKLEWDIEAIASVRETIREYVVSNKNLMTEMEFYPYLEKRN